MPPKKFHEEEWPRHPLLAHAIAEGWFVGDEIRPTVLTDPQAAALLR